jgi:toxin ParE1/3/4
LPRIIRTETAKEDSLAIAAYIATDNPSAADRWLESLDEKLALLAASPLLGEMVEYLAPGIRRHCFGNYLIFYRPIADGIELHRVLHAARRIEDLF